MVVVLRGRKLRIVSLRPVKALRLSMMAVRCEFDLHIWVAFYVCGDSWQSGKFDVDLVLGTAPFPGVMLRLRGIV